ncbi:sodium-dependent glucose transporter 1B-like [Littorina saxatilis]|uniref:Sodium-dependent glucose transporter 1 n=1 Tax=Littorina saxatilis TaxID=31220 RepID=A0AAN9GII6_9CAEN
MEEPGTSPNNLNKEEQHDESTRPRTDGIDLGDKENDQEIPVSVGMKVPDFEKRLLHTAVYFFGFFTFGWVVGQRGAVFLDLLLVTGTDVTLGSILFTVAGLASIAGGLAGGFLLDTTRKPILMMTMVFVLNAALNSTLALCEPLPLMSTLYFLSHFALSVYDVVVNPELANLWPGSSSDGFLQGLHFSFAVGAVLSPLATQPFLAPRANDTHLIPIKDVELELQNTEDMNSYDPGDNAYGINNATVTSVHKNITAATEAGWIAPQETKVIYALLISGALCLVAAIMHTILAGCRVQKQKQSEESSTEGDLPDTLRTVYIASLVMLGVYNFFGSSVEDVFPHYLMTFVVRELDWTKTSGAHVTSVYWVGLSLGRLSGVGLVKILSPTKIILGCLTLIIASLLALLLAAAFRHDWAVWICTAAVGLSVSVLFPTGLIYAHVRITRLTGRLAALIFTTPMMAAMVNPILLATLMTRYDDMWYVYVFLVQSALALTSFLVLHVLANKLAAGRRGVTLSVNVEMEETRGSRCDGGGAGRDRDREVSDTDNLESSSQPFLDNKRGRN